MSQKLRKMKNNPNKGTKGNDYIARSLQELGAARSIVATADGEVIAGNHVLEQAEALGIPTRVVQTDGSELVVVQRTDVQSGSDKAMAIAVADNRATELSLEWDEELLNSMNINIEDFPSIGNEDMKIGGGGTASEFHQVVEDEYNPPSEVEAIVQRGDVWMLGKHRLMCGDSTDADAVAKLMNGERADIAFTSPPYGVNDGSLREHKVAGQSSHADDNFYLEHDDNMSTWPDLIEKTWQNMNDNSDQQFINIQMLRDNKRELVRWCARHADNLCDILIWDKNRAAPQMRPNIVNNTFEFIYVFGEKDSTRVLKYGNFRGNVSAIVRVGVGQNEYADIHKAVFPVALPAEILNINGNAKSVLDLFGGTGTTMIAAEQLGRKCYMMEIDPIYCDIIIARWETLTGHKAIKLK